MNYLQEVYKEFNSVLGHMGPTYIAGGAVRDHLLGREPRDYDFFVCNQRNTTAPLFPLLENYQVIEDKAATTYNEFLVSTVLWNGLKVQIIRHPEPDVDGLLSTFDWNICLFAWDGYSIIAKECLSKIRPGNSLRLQRVIFPYSALRRGFLFADRYDLHIPQKVYNYLCKKLLVQSL